MFVAKKAWKKKKRMIADQTEAEMEEQIELLRSKGYNTILVTLVRGVDENTSYSGESVRLDYHLRQFIGYSLLGCVKIALRSGHLLSRDRKSVV